MTQAKRPSTRARRTPIQSLDDLQPDPLNANRGTDRGREALRRSLHTYGAGRHAPARRAPASCDAASSTDRHPELGHGWSSRSAGAIGRRCAIRAVSHACTSASIQPTAR